jgi:L-lactate dehydrogenase complex protein LldG
MTRSSREQILNEIRRATGGPSNQQEVEYAGIRREYRLAGTLNPRARLKMFLDRLNDYNARTVVCEPDRVAEHIASTLTSRGKQRIIVPAGFPRQWLPAGFEFIDGAGLNYRELDRSDGVLTQCSLAVAFTGTIILQDQAPGEGARALTLVPDYHLCIVDEARIVETVPEAVRALEDSKTVAITTISGPSATADIEMTRIKGVHGPRTLDVIIIGAVPRADT